ncbi:MAG: T9SS type A sorting domain-containing protein [Legionellales bacterium]
MDIQLLSKSSNLHIAVTKLRSDGTRFLYVNYLAGGTISRYKVTGTGIYYDNYTIGANNADFSYTTRSEMELVSLPSGNYRIAVPYAAHIPPTAINITMVVYVADIDFVSGDIIFGTEKYLPLPTGANPHGLEFSGNGRYLYVSHTQAPFLQYVDLQTGSPAFSSLQPSISNPLSLFNPQDFQYSQIELGNDGALYFAGSGGLASLQIHFINKPQVSTWNNGAVPGLTIPISNAIFTAPDDVSKIRLLNDQIDGEIYQTYSSTAPASSCCLFNTVLSADVYTAGTAPYTTSSQTWTPTNNPFRGSGPPIGTLANPVTIKTQLVIPAGVHVTINGMIFNFAPRDVNNNVQGAMVVIQQGTGLATGGSLVLDQGTVFTTYDNCGVGMWEGIEVRGRASYAQGSITNSQQGWLVVGRATIKNAYRGAITTKMNNHITGTGVVPSAQGGVIRTGSGAQFINNAQDVAMYPYNFVPNNASSFYLTNFITTAHLQDPNATVYTHLLLWDVKQIQIKGCNFENATSTGFSPYSSGSGQGIISFTAGYNVGQYVPTSGPNTPCTFKNLLYGVRASNGAVRYITVDLSQFTNNYRGVLYQNVLYGVITSNTFTVFPYGPSHNPHTPSYGIYLDHSSSFHVENNTLSWTAPYPLGFPILGYGIVVNEENVNRTCFNAGYMGDRIYKNHFHNILVGCQAQGNNSENAFNCYSPSNPYPNNVGLQFLCNDFAPGTIPGDDIVVADDLTQTNQIIHEGNIGYIQGSCSSALQTAGNQFSHTCSGPDNDYSIPATVTPTNPTIIDYAYSTGQDPHCFTPATLNSGVALTNCPSDPPNCPSTLNHKEPQGLKILIGQYRKSSDSINVILAGGDGQNLMDTIATGSISNIKTSLLAKSPYLSDRVLMAAVNKGLPGTVLRDILIPNSPLTKSVEQAVDHLHLNHSVQHDIDAAQVGTSARTTLIQLQGAYNVEIGYLFNELIRAPLADTTKGIRSRVDTVAIILSNDTTARTASAQSQLTKAFVAQGDILNATASLTAAMNAGASPSFSKMMDAHFRFQTDTNGYNTLLMDTALLASIRQVRDDEGSNESRGARGLFRVMFQDTTLELVTPLKHRHDHGDHDHSMIKKANTVESINSKLILYPNPVNDNATVAYTLPDNAVKAFLDVFDMAGRKVTNYQLAIGSSQTTINTVELSGGIYFCSLVVDGIAIDKIKFVIQK